MFTSVLVLALTGPMGINPNQEPIWLDDYGSGCKQCEKVGKPLILFVGSGAQGWKSLSRDGQIGQETSEILAQKYVCVYIDTNRKEGRELAMALEIPNHLGIVISDSTGHYQAFRHEGDLRNQDLNRYLRRYSDPQRVVASTESNPGDEAPARYSGSSNVVAPASYRSYSVGRSC